MIIWFFVTAPLLVWTAIFCIGKLIADFRGPTPAKGVWGLFAAAGAVSTLAMMVVVALVSTSGI